MRVEKVEAEVQGAAEPRRFSLPLYRDYTSSKRGVPPVLMRLATVSPFGLTPTRRRRRSCLKSAAGGTRHMSEALLPATAEASRDFPVCVVK